MQKFLSLLAENLYGRYGDEISSLCILLPSRRARLFFTDALANIAGKPLWAPTFRTVDDIMQQYSGIAVAEKIPLLTDLYKVYSRFHTETFDSFYYWGEMLLSDFDSIDKYMIDAGMLLRNVAELKEMEQDNGYLEPEQAEIISRFWKSFGHRDDYSDEQRRFLDIWSTLHDIYKSYRDLLLSKELGYGGMVYRLAAENIRAGKYPDSSDHKGYIVAGFNALSESEKILFKHLSSAFDAEFYWDYDDYYASDREQEAGLFIRENRKMFPQKFTLGSTDNFSRPKSVTVVSTPSDSMQCKYAGYVLERIYRDTGIAPGKETAVVLTDENLMMPVLSSVPDTTADINVTMGYPLRLTPAYALYEILAGLQARKRVKGDKSLFRYSDINSLLTHPYIVDSDMGTCEAAIKELRIRQLLYPDMSGLLPCDSPLAELFETAGEDHASVARYLLAALSVVARSGSLTGPENGRDRDNIALIADTLRQASNSLTASGLDVSGKIFLSLVRKILQNTRIPFEGEPLKGVQVMGILETRNLDFRNVVILSMNDDNFPGNRVNSYSFIPYNLRLAYGLPTPQHHEGVYAYYFYRLLQRAESVHLVYSSRADEKSSGEQSRYIYQLQYESPHRLKRLGIGLDVTIPVGEGIEVPKTGATAAELAKYLDGEKLLSPTSFHNFIACPLKFYFHSIAGLSSEEEPGEEIDAPMFGTILHRSMELLYGPLCGILDPRPAIKAFVGTAAVNDAVHRAVREEYLRGDATRPQEYGGNLMLITDIIIRYINKCILTFDAGAGEFRILRTEEKTLVEFSFLHDGNAAKVSFKGLADRTDMLPDGRIRVVDYKTGRETLSFNGPQALFSPLAKERNAAAFQTLLYGMMLSRSHGRDVQPALYFVRSLNAEGYSPLLMDRQNRSPVTSYRQYAETFERLLADKLCELFDHGRPFTACGDPRTCQWCEFSPICKK